MDLTRNKERKFSKETKVPNNLVRSAGWKDKHRPTHQVISSKASWEISFNCLRSVVCMRMPGFTYLSYRLLGPIARLLCRCFQTPSLLCFVPKRYSHAIHPQYVCMCVLNIAGCSLHADEPFGLYIAERERERGDIDNKSAWLII